MPAIIRDMKLRDLIASKTTIRTPGGLREHFPEMSRQQAWALWHGKTTLGLRTAKRLSETLKIPLEELAEVDEAVPGKPRQRNRQPPPDGAPE